MLNRIAIVASSIDSIKQAHLLSWYQSLHERSNNVKLFLGSRNNDIPYAKNFKINSKKDYLKFFLKFKIASHIQPLIDYKPKIIHLLTSNAFHTIEGALEADTKLIVSFRGFDINVFPFISTNNLQKTIKIFERANILHFISDNLMESAVKLGAKREKCIIITRSINLDSFEKFSNLNEQIIISSIGRLVWEKGYLYALETMAILYRNNFNFKYYIAGDGLDKNMLKFHINRLQLNENVELLGELARSEVYELLKRTDIYFQPSLTEALSNSILEASYFKIPVVSSNIGGIPEIVKNDFSGFLSDICKPNDYAQSIITLIDDKNLRLLMGENGHKIIKDKFDRKIEIEKWLTLYQNQYLL